MTTNSLKILKYLLDKNDSQKKIKLLTFLSTQQKDTLNSIPSSTVNNFNLPLLNIIHYSWLITFLKKFSKEEVNIFINALDLDKTILISLVKVEYKKIQITPFAKKFIKNFIIKEYMKNHSTIMPLFSLPDSSLNIILNCSKEKLIKIIDLLPIYDLSFEIKKIVKSNILKTIHEILSKDQKKFLATILNNKEKFLSSLNLQKWSTEKLKTNLKKTLHTRGLYKLAHALYKEDPNLIWYICKKLDIGRGTLLTKFIKDINKKYLLARIQVLDIMSFLKNKELL